MSPEADSLAAAKAPVFLLLAAPESQQYADVLKTELEQLQSKFVVDPIAQNRVAQLYRLTTKPK
jgi:hypothetical protein